MNSINLTGRAVKEIELRYTPSGKAVASGTIAVQRKFKNAQGEYESDFIDFVSWGKGGELMANHIKKGEHFGITGTLQTRTYENNEGRKIKVTEVNVSDFDFPVRPKSSNQGNNQNTNQSEPPKRVDTDPFANDGKPIDISDNDLPF